MNIRARALQFEFTIDRRFEFVQAHLRSANACPLKSGLAPRRTAQRSSATSRRCETEVFTSVNFEETTDTRENGGHKFAESESRVRPGGTGVGGKHLRRQGYSGCDENEFGTQGNHEDVGIRRLTCSLYPSFRLIIRADCPPVLDDVEREVCRNKISHPSSTPDHQDRLAPSIS